MTNNHGKRFDIGSNITTISSIVNNRSFYLDNTTVDYYNKNVINSKLPLLFLSNDVEQSIQKSDYELILHGILPCGSKTTIIIAGIYPYVEVNLDADVSDSANKSRFIKILSNLSITSKSMTITTGKNFMGYQHDISKYLKIEFNTLGDRLAFINYCNKINIKTTSNDKSTYYRVVGREYKFNLSNWNKIDKYQFYPDNKYKSRYVFKINVTNIKAFDYTCDSIGSLDMNLLKYENMILASFDIEMCPENLYEFPDADVNVNDTIFMIAITFHFTKKAESLINVVLTIKDSVPIDDAVIIKCANESTLLEAFSYIIGLMQPEFITEFNGGGFDWRNIMSKVVYHNILDNFMSNMSLKEFANWELNGFTQVDYQSLVKLSILQKKKYKNDTIQSEIKQLRYKLRMLLRFYDEKFVKINGATADSVCKSLKLPGYINFDTLIIFRQLEPNAGSHKLNDCLKRCNLGSKDDLDPQKMFKIYLNGTTEEMGLVSHYCLVDTYKLQAMILKKNVIQDRREVATLSYTSLYDSFYYANGGKVRNLLMSIGYERNLKFDTTLKVKTPCCKEQCSHRTNSCYYSNKSTKTCSDVKYPGAFVVPPIKGIVRPMLKIDEFLRKDDLVCENIDDAYALIDKYYDDIYINNIELSDEIYDQYDIYSNDKEVIKKYFKYVSENENQYPISGLDFSSLYPSIIMTYNLSPEYMVRSKEYATELELLGIELTYINFDMDNNLIEGWFIKHNNDVSKYGLCPDMLIALFDQRATLKTKLKPYADKKTELEIEMIPYKNKLHEFPKLKEYEDVIFNYNYFDSKQKAVKVFMNTLYGEMGNFLSFICALEVAGSVTTMGKYNLMLARDIVEREFNVKTYYGDSVIGSTPIYLECPNNKYNENAHQYISRIDDIITSSLFEKTNDGKEIYTFPHDSQLKVYSDTGFIKVTKIIRHCTTKQLFRIKTLQGVITVTEDHSLINSSGNIIKPGECVRGTPLLIWNSIDSDTTDSSYKSLSDIIQETSLELDCYDNRLFIYGLFYRYGRIINNTIQLFVSSYNDRCIINKYVDGKLKYANGIYIHEFDSAEDSELWEAQCYTSVTYKKRIPDFIINADKESQLSYIYGAFLNAYNETTKQIIFEVDNDINAQVLFIVFTKLNYKVHIEYEESRILLLLSKTVKTDIVDNLIISIENMGSTYDYVYDLETETHHFAAGIGSIVVHNTDSLYISCDKNRFYKFDKDYFSNKITKLNYATKLVEETFVAIDECKVGVNLALTNDNGSKFLKMAYEEVLYPAVFLSKKKYYGIPHEEIVNFKPKKPFIRGLEVVKRGVSDVLKNVCMDIMWSSLDLHNIQPIIYIVADGIKKYFDTKWDMNDFIKTAVYRLDKENISVKTLIARLTAINYKIIPEPNVRFNYVIIKKYPYEHDIKGNQKELSVGDRMELVERAIEEDLPIDLEYYFNNEITGQLARLIACDSRFDTYDRSLLSDPNLNLTDKEKYKKIEDEIFKNCKKYISEIAKQYNKPYENKGILFKETYRTVKSKVIANSNKIYNNTAAKGILAYLPDIQFSGNRVNDIKHHFKKYIQKDSSNLIQQADKLYKKLKSTNVEIDVLYNYNSNGYVSRLHKKFDAEVDQLVVDMIAYIDSNKLQDIIFGLNNHNVVNIIDLVKTKYNFHRICENNEPVNTLDEIVSNEELDEITSDENLYIQISDDDAKCILNYIIKIMTIYKMMDINERVMKKAHLHRNAKNHIYLGNEDLF